MAPQSLGLPFDEIIALDFEYVQPDGENPRVICMVAREVNTGKLHRVWEDEFGDEPPFRTDSGVCFVAYNLVAEWSCFLQLGWDIPITSLDCYTEFLAETNGKHLSTGKGYLGALAYHDLMGLSSSEKTEMRELVMSGGPWTDAERLAILDYCQTDVDPLIALLERMLPAIQARHMGLGRSVLRARYMAAVARMEHYGVPIDTDALEAIRAAWDDIRLDLISEVDQDFGVYEGTSFRSGPFREYVEREGLVWPKLPGTGRLALDGDTFRDMSKTYPQITPLYELRHSLGELRTSSLQVGPDGRNRVSLMPLRSKTGRNQPSNTKFIFGPAKWMRSLIKAPPGMALAYIDWSSQEVAIAAHLSGDRVMIEAINSGDPYIAFAIAAGMLPEGTTKHDGCKEDRCEVCDTRNVCKTVVLGVNYGMQAESLAYRTGRSHIEASELLRRAEKTWPVYTEWCVQNVSHAQLAGHMETVMGWPMVVQEDHTANSLRNFPMQGNGAEMMRLACILATEDGIRVCAPIHDALLIEAPVDEIEEAVERTIKHMIEASRVVLGGPTVGADVEYLIRDGERIIDARGEAMWERVCRLAGVETK